MKPIYLEIQAFGAFVDKQSIDFQKLSQDRLFLIHGATGAGKTTIFDAICFVLYGETTSMRTGEAMRSQYANDSLNTEIIFTFESKQQYYYVKRTFRVKRGGKTLDEDQVFAQIDFDGTYSNTPTYLTEPIKKKSEIEKKIIEIIGFEAAQFKQLVILPQGKFQELLLSNVDKKSEILTQLFNAELYDSITENLLKQKKEAKEKQDFLKQEETILLKTAQQDNIENLQNQLTREKINIENLENELVSVEQIQKTAHKAYLQAKEESVLFASYDKISQAIRKHLETETQQNNLIEQIKIAEKAETLRPVMDEGKRLKNLLEKQKEKIDNLKNTLLTDKNNFLVAKNKVETHTQIQIEVKELQIVLNDLEKLQPILQQNSLLAKDIKEYKTHLTNLEQDFAILHTNLQNIDTEIAKLQTEKEENKLAEKAKQLSGLVIENDTIKRLGAIYKDVKKLRVELDNLQKNFSELQEESIAEQQKYLRIKQNWHLSQAAFLSEQLVAMQPCVVCGSTSHPNPAQKNALYVSTEQHEKAAQHYEGVQKKVQYLEKEITKLQTSLAEKEQNLEDWQGKTEAEIISFAKNKQAALKDASEAENRLAQIEETMRKITEKRKNYVLKIEETKEQIAEQTKKVAIVEEKQKDLQSKIPQEITNLSSLTEQIASKTNYLQKLVQQIDQENKVYATLQTQIAGKESEYQTETNYFNETHAEIKKLQENLQQKIELIGFQQISEVQSAMQTPETIEKWRKNVQEWEKNRFSLQEQYREIKQKVENLTMPDTEASEKKWQEAEKLLKITNETLTSSKEKHKHTKNICKNIEDIQQKYQIEYEKTKYLFELATLANGENSQKLKFQDFVLQLFFKEVLLFANQRLQLLSQGRYELELVEGLLRANKRAGLDLQVIDYYTGGKRLVQQLSGGETFFTSLSLALGLADVAAAKSGGLHLDAIFIDEGFGTLDPETLDLAIRTLMELDGNFRMVGIISHVQDLKERIPTKLEVIKGKKGSNIAM
jgi:exonuclease SbcC